MSRCFPIAFTLVFFVIQSCSDDPTTPQCQLTACSCPVAVTVGLGTTITFSWSPACSLFLLLVEEAQQPPFPSSGGGKWSVVTDSTNAIGPPVTYGVVPPGANANVPPPTLVSGTSYEVSVFRWTGPGKQDGDFIGSKIFTPSGEAPGNFTVSTSDFIVWDLSWTISDPTTIRFYHIYTMDPFTGQPALRDTVMTTSVQYNTTFAVPGLVWGVSSVSIGHVESAITIWVGPTGGCGNRIDPSPNWTFCEPFLSSS